MNAYLALAAVLSLGVAFQQGWTRRGEHDRGQAAIAQQLIHDTREQAQLGAADAISQIKINNVTIRQRAETVVREVPVYRECRHAPGMLDRINAALTGASEPAGASELPASAAAR